MSDARRRPVQPFGQPAGRPRRPATLSPRGASRSARRVVAPLLTVLIAFLIGGLVVLVTTGKTPSGPLQGDLRGTGLNWFFPWVTGDERRPRSTSSRR